MKIGKLKYKLPKREELIFGLGIGQYDVKACSLVWPAVRKDDSPVVRYHFPAKRKANAGTVKFGPGREPFEQPENLL